MGMPAGSDTDATLLPLCGLRSFIVGRSRNASVRLAGCAPERRLGEIPAPNRFLPRYAIEDNCPHVAGGSV